MSAARGALAALGLAVLGWGAWLLLSTQHLAQLRSAGLWVAGGVLVHDAVLAPATLLLTAAAARVLPRGWRGTAAGVLVVVGTVTVLAVPVLGGWGRGYDAANRTYLDRDYHLGWLLLVVVVVAAALAGRLLGRVRRRRRTGGPGPSDPERAAPATGA